MSSVRTKFFTGVAAVLAVIALSFIWVLHERNMQTEFARKALRAAKDVSMSYDSAVKEDSALLKASLVDSDQKAAFEKLEAIAKESVSEDEKDIIAVIHRIGRLQSAAFSFLGSLSEVQSQEEPFSGFQKMIGDKSTVNELIATYNKVARGLNVHSSALMGSVVQDAFGNKPQELPYLRIDGIEDEMSIQL